MTKPRNRVGAYVRSVRLSARPPITQEELVARLAIRGIRLGRAAVSKIENGDRAVTDLEVVAFAEALGVSVATLLGIGVEQPSGNNR